MPSAEQDQASSPCEDRGAGAGARGAGIGRGNHDRPRAGGQAMDPEQTHSSIAGNTGPKQAMCIKVLRGSSSKGKFKRKVAHVGDVIICAVKKAMPASEIKQGEIIRCVVVRTKQPTVRSDGSLVRFDRNAAVVIDAD